MEAGQTGPMIGDHATNPVDLELGGKREPVPTRDPLMEAETVPGKDLKDHWNVTTGPVWKVNTKSNTKTYDNSPKRCSNKFYKKCVLLTAD